MAITHMTAITENAARKMLLIGKKDEKVNSKGEVILDKEGNPVLIDKLPDLVKKLALRVEKLISNKTTNHGLSNESVALIIAFAEHLETLYDSKKG